MAGNNGGPWGGGGGSGDKGGNGDDRRPSGGGRKPGDGPQIPEIDEIVRKGQEQLRVLMGGRGGGNRSNGPGGGGGPHLTRGTFVIAGLVAVGALDFRLALHGEAGRAVGRAFPGRVQFRSAILA